MHRGPVAVTQHKGTLYFLGTRQLLTFLCALACPQSGRDTSTWGEGLALLQKWGLWTCVAGGGFLSGSFFHTCGETVRVSDPGLCHIWVCPGHPPVL